MARIQDYYQNRRDLGPSAMVAYLDAWLDERAGMNKSLMASDGKQADPSRLAEQEARIRAALADLLKAKVSGSVEEMKAADDLAGKLLDNVGEITVANVKAGSDRAVALIQARTDLSKQDIDSREAIAKELKLTDPEGIKIISSAYKTAKTNTAGNPKLMADDLVQMVHDITKSKEGGLRPKQDAAAAAVLQQAKDAGDDYVVKRIEDAFFAGDAADDYFEKTYPGFTIKEQAKVYEEVKKLGAGASTKAIEELYGRLTAEGKGGGGTKTSTSYSSIVPDLDAKIKSLEDAADDLAKARREAMTSPKRFPRPNYMIANPNTFTDPRQVAELRKWGVLDPTYVEEMVTARQREGTWAKAIESVGERGGASQSIEKVAPLVLTEEPGAQVTYTDAEAAWLGALKRAGSGEPFPGKGGYTYTLNADGSITSLAPEKGKKPVKVEKGSAPHTAILEEVFPAPGLPDEVSDLYAPSIELAKAGQWAKAAEAAEKVSHDDVRSAYAQALVDVASGRPAFAGVPPEGQMEAMAASIGEGGGKWGEHFRDLLRQPTPNQYAKSRVMGAVDSLGKALHKTPDVEDRIRAEDSWEAKHGLDEVIAGRDVSPEAYGRGKAKGETALKDLDATSDKRVREAERTLELLDEWEKKNPHDSSEKSDSPLRKTRDEVDAVRLRLERELAQIKSKARADLPRNIDVTVTELDAGRLGLKGDEALGAKRALEAKQTELKAPPPPAPITYFDGPLRASPLAAPDSVFSVADEEEDSDPDPKFDFYKKAREAQQLLKSLDQWETENPRPTDPRQLRGWEESRESVEFTRKEAEKKLEASRSEMQPSLDIDLIRDRAAAAEVAAPPPVSAAKPPPAAFDYAELFSASATPTDELDYDLDELMGRAPAGAKR